MSTKAIVGLIAFIVFILFVLGVCLFCEKLGKLLSEVDEHMDDEAWDAYMKEIGSGISPDPLNPLNDPII